MTKNQKIMIGIGAAVLFCLCACGAAFLTFRYFGQRLSQAANPADAAKVADKIAHFEVPAGYGEQMGMDFGLYRMVMLAAKDDPLKPMIMLMGYNQNMGMSSQQMQEQLQRTFEQQTGTPGVTWSTVEERKMTIRGQEVNVIVREGKMDDGRAVLRQLITAFDGENGMVLVMIQGDAASWDDKLVNDFLSSIQ